MPGKGSASRVLPYCNDSTISISLISLTQQPNVPSSTHVHISASSISLMSSLPVCVEHISPPTHTHLAAVQESVIFEYKDTFLTRVCVAKWFFIGIKVFK